LEVCFIRRHLQLALLTTEQVLETLQAHVK
jgi:hypothetical protein